MPSWSCANFPSDVVDVNEEFLERGSPLELPFTEEPKKREREVNVGIE